MEYDWKYVFFCESGTLTGQDAPYFGQERILPITFWDMPELHVAMCEALWRGGIDELRTQFGATLGEISAFIATPLPADRDAMAAAVNFASLGDVLLVLDHVRYTDPADLAIAAFERKFGRKRATKKKRRKRS